jgi:hypothetical protein
MGIPLIGLGAPKNNPVCSIGNLEYQLGAIGKSDDWLAGTIVLYFIVLEMEIGRGFAGLGRERQVAGITEAMRTQMRYTNNNGN